MELYGLQLLTIGIVSHNLADVPGLLAALMQGTCLVSLPLKVWLCFLNNLNVFLKVLYKKM